MALVVNRSVSAAAEGRQLHAVVRRVRTATCKHRDIASVSYDADVYEMRVVVERVNDAVVSHADSPQVGGALQLHASTRPWIFRQSLDTRDDPSRHAGLQAFEFAPS